MTRGRVLIGVPPASKAQRIERYVDWVESLPLRVRDIRNHPGHAARTGRFKPDDWRAVEVEFAKRRDQAAPIDTIDAERAELVRDLVVWVTDHPGVSPLESGDFVTRFADATRAELRVALAHVGRVAAI